MGTGVNKLRLWLAFMGTAQTIAGGLGALAILPGKTVGFLVLVVAGLHVGTALYISPPPSELAATPAPTPTIVVQGQTATPPE